MVIESVNNKLYNRVKETISSQSIFKGGGSPPLKMSTNLKSQHSNKSKEMPYMLQTITANGFPIRIQAIEQTEADLLNEVVFQTTAKQFREQNPSLVQKRQNIRDTANTIELTVLANMEAYNSQLIASNLSRSNRYELLIKESERQFSIFYQQNKIT